MCLRSASEVGGGYHYTAKAVTKAYSYASPKAWQSKQCLLV